MQNPLLPDSSLSRVSVPKEIGCTVEWTNVKVEVVDKSATSGGLKGFLTRTRNNKLKTVVDSVSGVAKPGELTGIIGASGGGKTSLLCTLAGRIGAIDSLRAAGGGRISGRVALNGHCVDLARSDALDTLRCRVAYMLQSDVLLEAEKARDAIEASAKLRMFERPDFDQLSAEQMTAAVKQRVDVVMEALGIEDIGDTVIGGESLRGLSGGERKRVSLALELVTKPQILFCDELTSGLDSSAAFETMALLKAVCGHWRTTALCTLHQPSSEMFALLDRVVVLAQGRAVFEGSVPQLDAYLRTLAFECPPYSNLADFALHSVSENTQLFADAWKRHCEEVSNGTVAAELSDGPLPPRRSAPPLWFQFKVILRRSLRILRRQRVATAVRSAQTLGAGFLFGLIFWQMKPLSRYKSSNQLTAAQNKLGIVYLCTILPILTAISNANLTFPSQRLVFQKERASDWYNTLPWVCAKLLIDSCLNCCILLPFSAMVHCMVHLQCSWPLFFAIVCGDGLVADAIGFFIGSFASDAAAAFQLTPVLTLPLMLFSNYYVSLRDVTAVLRWIKWIDPYYYGIEMLAVHELDGEMGAKVLHSYHMTKRHLHRDYLAMFALFVAFRLLGIASLIYRNGW